MAHTLTPPRFEDIIADAQMYFAAQSARATDFNPGSVVRTILEIVAQIQERRDVAVWASLDRSIDEAVFDAWGFPREEAQAATGQITLFPGVGVTTPFIVRQGALFRVPDSPTLIYQAISRANNPDGTNGWDTVNSTDAVWFSNPNINASTLNVRAVTPGASLNVGAKLVTQALSPIPGIADIKNLQAFTNGRDASTDADRRAAFTAYIQSLPRGTVDSLKYGAKTAVLRDAFGMPIEQVKKVSIVEGTDPATVVTHQNASTTSLTPGKVGVFAHTGGPPISSALLAHCQEVLDGYYDDQGRRIDGWRSAGIVTTVYAARTQAVPVELTVQVARGFQLNQVAELVKLAIQNVFNVLDVGETLRLSDLLMFIKLVPGVLDAEIIDPTTSLTPAVNGLLVLQSITGMANQDNHSVSLQFPTSA